MNLRLFISPGKDQDLRWAMMWREVVITPQAIFDLQMGMIRLLLKTQKSTPLTRRKEIEMDRGLMDLETKILRMLDRKEN